MAIDRGRRIMDHRDDDHDDVAESQYRMFEVVFEDFIRSTRHLIKHVPEEIHGSIPKGGAAKINAARGVIESVRNELNSISHYLFDDDFVRSAEDDDYSHSRIDVYPPPLPEIDSSNIITKVFTHKSAAIEEVGPGDEATYKHNERLEFLGDSYLNHIMTTIIYSRFPSLREGDLTSIRSKIISNNTLCDWALLYGFDEKLTLSRSAELAGVRKEMKICADTFEAYVAGYMEDKDYSHFAFLRLHKWLGLLVEPLLLQLEPRIMRKTDSGINRNAKSELYTAIGSEFTKPEYHTVEVETAKRPGSTGQGRSTGFVVECTVNSEVIGVGWGKSQKDASLRAAMKALDDLDLISHHAKLRKSYFDERDAKLKEQRREENGEYFSDERQQSRDENGYSRISPESPPSVGGSPRRTNNYTEALPDQTLYHQERSNRTDNYTSNGKRSSRDDIDDYDYLHKIPRTNGSFRSDSHAHGDRHVINDDMPGVPSSCKFYEETTSAKIQTSQQNGLTNKGLNSPPEDGDDNNNVNNNNGATAADSTASTTIIDFDGHVIRKDSKAVLYKMIGSHFSAPTYETQQISGGWCLGIVKMNEEKLGEAISADGKTAALRAAQNALENFELIDKHSASRDAEVHGWELDVAVEFNTYLRWAMPNEWERLWPKCCKKAPVARDDFEKVAVERYGPSRYTRIGQEKVPIVSPGEEIDQLAKHSLYTLAGFNKRIPQYKSSFTDDGGDKRMRVMLYLGTELVGIGEGTTSRQASARAAMAALRNTDAMLRGRERKSEFAAAHNTIPTMSYQEKRSRNIDSTASIPVIQDDDDVL